MRKIYFIKDTKTNSIDELFLDINLASVVRTIRALSDQDKIRTQLTRIARWDDSILYELTQGEDGNFTITNKFALNSITQLKKPDDLKVDTEIKNFDILENTVKSNIKNEK